MLSMSAELKERERPKRRGIKCPTARDMELEDVRWVTTAGGFVRSWPSVSTSCNCQGEEAKESRLLCSNFEVNTVGGRLNHTHPLELRPNGGDFSAVNIY